MINLSYKKIMLIGAVVILVGSFFIWRGYLPKEKSYEFAGRIEKIVGDTIYLKGVYAKPAGGYYPQYKPEGYNAKIQITPKTKFVKTLLYLPDPRLTGGAPFNTDDLKKENIPGTREDVSKVDGIFVKTARNIYLKNSFKAMEIRYISPVSYQKGA